MGVIHSCPTKLFMSPQMKEIGCKEALYWAFPMPIASGKTYCCHIEKACRHMWRMATGLDNAGLNATSDSTLS